MHSMHVQYPEARSVSDKHEIKKDVEEKIKALKDIIEAGSKADLDAKASELQQAMMKIGAAMGQQNTQGAPSQEAPAAGDSAAPPAGDKKVEEGEVVG